MEVARLSPNGTLDESACFEPPTNLFWHDSTITEEFVVGVTAPFAATTKAVLGALLGLGGIGGAYKWDDTQKAEVLYFILLHLIIFVNVFGFVRGKRGGGEGCMDYWVQAGEQRRVRTYRGR